MLFKILKLFGINIPARMAEVRTDFEERFVLVARVTRTEGIVSSA